MSIPAATTALAIKTASGASINTGIWTLVAIMAPIAGGIILAIIKQWGPWKTGESVGRAADFARLRQDIADLKLVNTDVTTRMAAAESTIVWQTVRLGQQDFVIKMMTDELEVVSPGNLVARRVRTLLDQIVPAVSKPPDPAPATPEDGKAIAAAMARLKTEV
jgi:hypothetical protein